MADAMQVDEYTAQTMKQEAVQPSGGVATTPATATPASGPDNGNGHGHGHGNGNGNGGEAPMHGANAELLMNMMSCVDSSLFSPQQLQNWEQMKQRIKTASEQNVPLVMPGSMSDLLGSMAPSASKMVATGTDGQGNDGIGTDQGGEYRQPLHREASIVDVLSCLLEQQPPSTRVLSSSGSNVLMNSEMKNRTGVPTEENRPTLKSLLSSNDFTMTEKKESLKHLLGFIDTSFATHPEPMTDVYKENEGGNMRRLSSLQLMRSFMMPNANTQAMGRTTSFEIIQAMLNATSNQVIQKPMSSQDSFRFQHLAHCLESIAGDVGYDNEDYGNEEVVQVDNLDNLLDYQAPPANVAAQPGQSMQQLPSVSSSLSMPMSAASSSSSGSATMTSVTATTGPHTGFVDTQSLLHPVNPSTVAFPQQEYGGTPLAATTTGFPGYSQAESNSFGTHPSLPSFPNARNMAQNTGMTGMINGGGGANTMGTTPILHSLLHSNPGNMASRAESMPPQQQQQQQEQQQQQMMQAGLMQPQQQAFSDQLSFQAMMAPNAGMMATTDMQGFGSNGRPNGDGSDSMLRHQQFNAMLQQQQQQQQSFHQQQQTHQGAYMHGQAGPVSISAQVKQQKQDAQGGAPLCSALGCNHVARVKGMCKLHGGGRRCKVEGCMKSAQTGHLCIAHGGGKPCNVEGCPKTAQSRGLCKQHGGGVRCKFEGCTKSCQSGGYCRGHGGGKRCEYPNCTKWAQKNGHCAKHAQEMVQGLQQRALHS